MKWDWFYISKCEINANKIDYIAFSYLTSWNPWWIGNYSSSLGIILTNIYGWHVAGTWRVAVIIIFILTCYTCLIACARECKSPSPYSMSRCLHSMSSSLWLGAPRALSSWFLHRLYWNYWVVSPMALCCSQLWYWCFTECLVHRKRSINFYEMNIQIKMKEIIIFCDLGLTMEKKHWIKNPF